MPRFIDDYRMSRFLKKTDVDSPLLLTIKVIIDENVAPDGQPEEVKPVCYWKESDVKPLILNITNMDNIAAACGSRDLDDFPGTVIEAYNDVSVKYNGNIGAVRVQAPRKQAVAPRSMAQAVADLDDDLPEAFR